MSLKLFERLFVSAMPGTEPGSGDEKMRETQLFSPFDGTERSARPCVALISLPAFDHIIMVFIGFSSIVMAFENPLHDPQSTEVKVLEVLSTIFTLIFLFEVVVKMIALGVFFNHAGTFYLFYTLFVHLSFKEAR